MENEEILEIERNIQGIIAEVFSKREDIISVYSDGSFSREDMVDGSDVDIAIICTGIDENDIVKRRIIQGRLYEWVAFNKEMYEDIDKILNHAGFTHDIYTAKIWYDPQNYFKELQSKIQCRASEIEFLKTRVQGQLNNIKAGIDGYIKSISTKDWYAILMNLHRFTRFALGLPTALQNKPVTNRRAYDFCLRDCSAGQYPEYPDLVLKTLGTFGFDLKQYNSLLEFADGVYEQCGLSRNEIDLNKIHMRIKCINPASSAWPVIFWLWSSIWILRRDKKDSEADYITAKFPRLFELLGMKEESDFQERTKLAMLVYGQAEQMVLDKFKD